MVPKMVAFVVPSPPLDHPFRDLITILTEGRFLDVFWSPFGPLLSLFWLPSAHCCLPLAPFCLHLARFWLPFNALGLTFADPCAQFSHFGGLLASFFIFVCIFDWNRMQNLILWKCSLKSRLLIKQIAYSQRVSHVPKQEANNLL